jgi:uncharacterized protein (UPF0212 family)
MYIVFKFVDLQYHTCRKIKINKGHCPSCDENINCTYMVQEGHSGAV